MNITIQPVEQDQLKAVYSIMALAGENMHRVLKLSHWHPFPDTEPFIRRLEGHAVYGVFDDELLIGTFNLSTIPEPYYLEDMSDYWMDTSSPATYFSAFYGGLFCQITYQSSPH